MSHHASTEREALIALLRRHGPAAATLCGQWRTAELAAHLVTRERRLDALPGVVLPVFASWTDKLLQRFAREDYSQLLHKLEHPPWWVDNTLVASFDVVEWFVHHEDVRRAQPQWQPRHLPRSTSDALWGKEMLHRLLLRKTGMAVRLEAPGFGHHTVGRGPVRAALTGDPGEILLFCFGRQSHCRVEVSGKGAARLWTTKLGF